MTDPSSAAFPPAVRLAVRESAAAFLEPAYGLRHVPEGPAAGAGIMSTISFHGDPSWAFALSFPEDSAVSVARAFAGFDIPFDGPDMGDVLGEIANVIAGDVSARLAEKGITAQMSLPTVVRGGNVCLLVPATVSATRLAFAGPMGGCWFDLMGTRADGLAFRRPGAQPG